MTNTPRLASLIARAIVHLNFEEPEKAKEVLFDALTEFNFTPTPEKENETHGNAAAA